jgi:uncharacterized membrane protein (UPF0127 family)
MFVRKLAAGSGLFVLLVISTVFIWHRHGDFIGQLFVGEEQTVQSTILVDEIPIVVTVVDTPESRAQGLSGRKSLAMGEGMFFVFETDGTPGFWMKDMDFAIDIIWISARGEVVDIHQGLQPDSYPASFRPKQPVRYVLEVPAGFTHMNNIHIGSKVDLEML